jgi:hypothetical protein
MVEEAKGKKKVPLSQMERYLEAHQETIGAFALQLKRGIIEQSEIEAILPKSFLYLYDVITQILRDNDILPK